jgi:hypothetical protein
MSEEIIWRTIESHPNYEVSQTGLIRNRKTGRIRKPNIVRGYEYTTLYPGGNRYRIHRLVAIHFLDPPEDATYEIDHIDRNRINNRIENLQWVSRSKNQLNKDYYARTKKDGLHFISKITQKKKESCVERVYYNVIFTNNGKKHSKNFKELDDAIAYRDKYIEEHPR